MSPKKTQDPDPNPNPNSNHKTVKNSPLLNRRIQIAPGTKLHDLAPVLVLVLDEIDGLHNVRVVQRRADAELGRELLDVLLLRLGFAAFAELLCV